MAQSHKKWQIAPKIGAKFWRNLGFFLTLRQNLCIMETAIIGRETEKTQLKRYINSSQSEFIAVYGRRRVGKTFLIKEMFEGNFTFRMTGKEKADTKEQLQNFHYALADFGAETEQPVTWQEAFRLLEKYIESLATNQPKIIFFDELPWLDSYRSDFVAALEYFWNNWAYYRSDIKLIVCGSATSWMLNNIINSRGGLHNRVTHQINMLPFTLRETEHYLRSRGFLFEKPEMIECYMVFGGVAYYLSLLEPDKSLAQNVESLFFRRNAELKGEFEKIYQSLFHRAEQHVSIVTALAAKGMGMTRQQIIETLHLVNNGNLSRQLRELEECEFIRSFVPFGKTRKDIMYQLIDPFTLFHFHFLANQMSFSNDYWLKMQSTPAYSNWCGYAFEIVCLNHIEQIVNALGIGGMLNTPCSWIYKPTKSILESEETDEDLKQGAQIDLLIDRNDKTISVCEMKYTFGEYEITKQYDTYVQRRLNIFRKVTKTKKTLVSTYITPFGLADNMYGRRVSCQVTGDDLFG